MTPVKVIIEQMFDIILMGKLQFICPINLRAFSRSIDFESSVNLNL